MTDSKSPVTWSTEGDINLAPERKDWVKSQIDVATADLLARDAAVFLHQSLSTPCLNVLEGAQGATLVDAQQREYLDFHGNNVHHVGFGHPHVIAAIKSQLDELSFCTRRYTNEVAVSFAEKLISFSPAPLRRVLFAPSGAAAIGMALKVARLATGRYKTISMWDSFHGATLDAISVGGEEQFRRGVGPLLPGAQHVPPCEPSACPFKCGDTCNLSCSNFVEYMLEREGDVAAVICETVRCSPSVPPPDFWKKIRAACDRHGALLILDEIPIGLGRTGTFFAFEAFGIVPDIVVLGKALGGGIMPLGAMIASERLNCLAESSIGHFTHEKNPVSCAAGLATLEVIESEGLVERARTMGEYAWKKLDALREKHPLAKGARGVGLLLGLELNGLPERGLSAATAASQAMYECLKRGLNFKVSRGNILTLTPPLTISMAEMDRAIEIVAHALAAVEASGTAKIDFPTNAG